ncbi:MAG: 30S ribosomal protein S9 [Planctomycetes bacterium]|nr:30S ribosomal protein S9 [Planctomycetota bacterium]
MTEEPTPSSEPVVPAPKTPEPAPAPGPKKKGAPGATYTWGTGRRKSSVARVRIRPGSGKFVVNKREVKDYFCIARDQLRVYQPLEITETQKSFDVFVNVGGGGITGQSDAIVLGLARALLKINPDYMPKLREHKLLRRDPRRVERKKYGQRGARRRFQFSKR